MTDIWLEIYITRIRSPQNERSGHLVLSFLVLLRSRAVVYGRLASINAPEVFARSLGSAGEVATCLGMTMFIYSTKFSSMGLCETVACTAPTELGCTSDGQYFVQINYSRPLHLCGGTFGHGSATLHDPWVLSSLPVILQSIDNPLLQDLTSCKRYGNPKNTLNRPRWCFTCAGTGFAEISIIVNSAPYGGHVEATPRTGVAVLDNFLLESLEWTDDADDLPLLFSFSYANGQVIQN